MIISDGGDNNSRYTEGELKTVLRESDVLIYSIWVPGYQAPGGREVWAQELPVPLQAVGP